MVAVVLMQIASVPVPVVTLFDGLTPTEHKIVTVAPSATVSVSKVVPLILIAYALEAETLRVQKKIAIPVAFASALETVVSVAHVSVPVVLIARHALETVVSVAHMEVPVIPTSSASGSVTLIGLTCASGSVILIASA